MQEKWLASVFCITDIFEKLNDNTSLQDRNTEILIALDKVWKK
jgi:hypothetical protein